jgi:subtilisin family serine protease
VLHALAPHAEIMLVNWEPDDPRSFLEAVRWAKSQGARVLSCSLIMPSWSDGEGGGEVHRGLEPVLGDGKGTRDVLFFASAGNTAQRHWCGHFVPNAKGWHQWHDDAAVNTLTPWGNDRVAVEFYGPTRAPFEVQVTERDSGDLIGRSVLQVDATRSAGRAVVRFEPAEGVAYDVKVRCLQSPAPEAEAFHLVALGGALDHASSRGSIPFPGDGARVFAVGAVDARKQRLAYSSCGPNSRLPKPDFMATVPFPSLCRARPFAGTSAAAPQAAALAALIWSHHPDWLPEQVTQALRESALDLGPPGHDCETGYGLIRLPK